MKCPQCNREMEDGFLEWDEQDNLAWVPKLLPLGLASWKVDAELLWPTIDTITKSGSRASICKACRKVVFDYGNLE